jgi:hypothetical protein
MTPPDGSIRYKAVKEEPMLQSALQRGTWPITPIKLS